MAYAAVVSLKQTIEFYLNHSQKRIHVSKSELEIVNEDISYLQSFLKTINSLLCSKRVEALERETKLLAHKLEDLIESYVSDQFLSESDSSGNESLTLIFSQELLKVKQELSSFAKTLNTNEEDQQKISSFASTCVSSRDIGSGGKIKMVGVVDELLQLLGWLVLDSSKLDVVSIVGMAGIGKTTLAKDVYYDSFVLDYFKFGLFITIGPYYQLRKVLLLALEQIGFPIVEMSQMSDRKLGSYLHSYLKGNRYLIVLDDVWSTRVWDDLKCFFPVTFRGNRVIVTTRLVDVAYHSNGSVLQMPFLNDDESWKLLHQMLFTAEEICDPQLEEIGKEIAKNCEGLPLAIIAVGNVLLEIEKTVENWEKAAKDDDLLVIKTDDDTPISRSLTLSYKQLPQYLKAYFLYMGVFPIGYKITTSKLIKLWVAEGFFEPDGTKSLEETAEECLDDLVSRSLVLVPERGITGRIKTCKLHFVFRKLCVSEAENEKFYHVMKKANSFPEGTSSQRRLCIHNNVVLSIKQVRYSMESVSASRSLLCYGPDHRYPLPVYLHFRLLRVLDVFAIRFYKFPNEVLKLVQLKYLAITYDGEHPESISRLWKLEVLIIRRYQSIKYSDAPVYLPIEIWNLQKLKHLDCMGFDVPEPSRESSLVLEKLLTLSGVSFHSCKPGVLARIPNLMKLGVRDESSGFFTNQQVQTSGDFANLHCLESFQCIVVNPFTTCRPVSSFPVFSDNLIKISLSGCGFSWEYMTYIGRLPNLEVLKLRIYSFIGPEWESKEQFLQLKLLMLEDLDIEHWGVERGHFPSLARLIIRHCYKLKSIPDEIGESEKLEVIELEDCNPYLASSAQQVYEAKHDWVNDHVRVQIRSSWNEKNRRS